MKIGIVTALSLTGVLAAGAAAFAVNSTVLNGTSDLATGITANSINSLSVDLMVSPTSTTPSATEITTFAAGDAGSVIMEVRSGVIVVKDVIANTNWTVESPMTMPNGDIRVHFNSGATRTELNATLLDGAIKVSVTDDSGSSSPIGVQPNKPRNPSTTMPPTNNSDISGGLTPGKSNSSDDDGDDGDNKDGVGDGDGDDD
ncbi:MAG: hypothetical protein NTU52_02375 [Actinobacteria bacterium]|nr:hypothetical protein [Actinomycetota bacterium]